MQYELNKNIRNQSLKEWLGMFLQYTFPKDTLRLKFEASTAYLKLNQVDLVLIKRKPSTTLDY